MKSKTKLFTLFFTLISFIFLIELFYLQNISDVTTEKSRVDKKSIEKIIALPNLAISSDELYIRNKSYANIFDILPNDGELHTNSKMSFVY